MDIQFCMDSYAVVTYVTDYLTKGDAGLTKELIKALLETKHCNNFDQLNHLKMTYFKNKQVSVAEATYRLVRGLDLKRSNIACIFVATGYPRNRSSFFVSTKADDEKSIDVEPLDDEEETPTESNKTPVTLEGKNGQFKEVQTIHQKYSQRPESLEDVCLAQFATSYSFIRQDRIPKDITWKNDASEEKGNLARFGREDELLPKFIKLSISGTFMALIQNTFI